MNKSLGIYIHIPFCEKKCDYCNFVSYCLPKQTQVEYAKSVIREVQMKGSKFKDYEVDTIFFGGGTPSCMPDGTISMILQAIYQNFSVKKDAEITIECNPNSLTVPKLNEYKKVGINRLSIGLQAYSNKLLKLVGRLHSKKQFDEAFSLARDIGFKNINVDLILGLPGQTLHNVKRELHHLKRLNVDHISAYGLIVEENTKLFKNLQQKVYKLPSEDKQLKMYRYTKMYLKKNGVFRYEVSNFAKRGFECEHNKKYWTEKEYLGIGAVASSFAHGERWKNTDNIKKYIDDISKNKVEREEVEQIDKQNMIEETIMLSLCTVCGIDLSKFENDFGFDILKNKKSEIAELQKEQLIQIKDGHLSCTDRGFEVLNQIVLQLVV